MKNKISVTSTVVANKYQVSCELSGESVILNLKSGIYYGLDAIGAEIWKLIQEPRTANDIREAILRDYDVDPSQCERDLLVLLEELAASELIEIIETSHSDETSAKIPETHI